MTFRERDEWELSRISDAEILAYVATARRAGRADAMRAALAVFAFRRHDDLVRFASARVPSRQDAEDLAQQAIESVFKAAFDGSATGEAVNFVYTILRRRIADFLEQRKRRGGPERALPEELDDDEAGGPDAAVEEDFAPAVDSRDVIERGKDGLSEAHRMVVDVYLENGFDAKETAAKVNTAFPDLDPPMSDANVHQIARRFRETLRDQLEP